MGSPRFLGVDIGNSGMRVVELFPSTNQLGRVSRLRWVLPISAPAEFKSSDHQTDEHDRFLPDSKAWLSQLQQWLDIEETVHWLISSVRSDACDLLSSAISRKPTHQIRHVRFDDLPIGMRVLEPSRVGIDRLLAAVAAVDVGEVRRTTAAASPLIVIQAGSAVTVDWVTYENGKAFFEGGAILPGVPMMLRLLGTFADQLPELDADLLLSDDLRDLPPLPGRDTEQAMLCGAASALVGGVRDLVDRYREKWDVERSGVSQVSEGFGLPEVILSGGDGPRLAPYIPEPLVVVPDLVLRGLLVMATEISTHLDSTS
jgi:pantothenate kinase type III